MHKRRTHPARSLSNIGGKCATACCICTNQVRLTAHRKRIFSKNAKYDRLLSTAIPYADHGNTERGKGDVRKILSELWHAAGPNKRTLWHTARWEQVHGLLRILLSKRRIHRRVYHGGDDCILCTSHGAVPSRNGYGTGTCPNATVFPHPQTVETDMSSQTQTGAGFPTPVWAV